MSERSRRALEGAGRFVVLWPRPPLQLCCFCPEPNAASRAFSAQALRQISKKSSDASEAPAVTSLPAGRSKDPRGPRRGQLRCESAGKESFRSVWVLLWRASSDAKSVARCTTKKFRRSSQPSYYILVIPGIYPLSKHQTIKPLFQVQNPKS